MKQIHLIPSGIGCQTIFPSAPAGVNANNNKTLYVYVRTCIGQREAFVQILKRTREVRSSLENAVYNKHGVRQRIDVEIHIYKTR